MDTYQNKTTINEEGITLTALVITIIVLLILAGTAINLTLGEDGIFRKALESADRYKAEAIKEQMEMIKTNTVIDNNGEFNIDDFLDNLVEEGIVGSREEITDNGDGSYTIVTNEGYVIDIIEKEDGKDIGIEYAGKGDAVGPRIKEIVVKNKTTSTIEIEVETINGKGAKYTYSYRKNGEGEYKEAEKETEENRYIFEGLESNKLYDIKVEVENEGMKTNKKISVYTGELPEGAITIGEVEWKEGKAEVVVNINKEIEGNLRLEYKINEDGEWIEIQDGEKIGNLELNQTVYVRLTDGINETEYASTSIKDLEEPEVSISTSNITSNSVRLNVTASDAQSGLASSETYSYYLNNELKVSNNTNYYDYTGLIANTIYILEVRVKDKAGLTTTKKTTITTVPDNIKDAIDKGVTYLSNTTIYDEYNNPIKVPVGFRIAAGSGTDVTKGVVIEDVSAGDNSTKGNQYVWVPIGNVKYNTSGEYKTINLGRYSFDVKYNEDTQQIEGTGKETLIQSADNYTSVVEIDVEQEYNYTEITSGASNAVAKNLGDFITKAKNAGGYYIGRYEAGKIEDNIETFNVKKGQEVYNNITQLKASTLARNIYSNNNFASDLINSYTWDTAIVFIQTFSGDADYSMQARFQDTLTTTGNAHDSSNNYDVRCNIYDMAGNVAEWSTETPAAGNGMWTFRGGYCNISSDTVAHRYFGVTNGDKYIGFRSILYL